MCLLRLPRVGGVAILLRRNLRPPNQEHLYDAAIHRI
ncbi:hypothetical protein Desmer_2965 [Desulfosporosinus meridiei DSM 13257]|uniref:Uncharacterized protein n=1 Tax=Desulfosporosinus meridiei (strain ATCC BAA-275 / DSM 13257 / KCTC 12902 / NCIMB 13706 / S10) TaxID=768704 RepID=J7IXI8_DESMD|nr:hypothetical protein Desmer_2965 [Desulfosporosinus meridiei DSM 13257]